jgi:hypothetical protein
MSQNYIKPTTLQASTPAADQPKIADNDDALLTNFSGATAPTPTYAGQHWFDTTSKILYVRNVNNDGWGTCSNPEIAPIHGPFSVNQKFDKTIMRAYAGHSANVFNLPQSSSVNTDFEFDIFIYDNSEITINSASNERFFYNGDEYTTLKLPPNSSNSLFTITKRGSDGTFFLGGSLTGVTNSLSNISDEASKFIFDLIHPVGSVLTLNANITPPFQGSQGVSWQVISTEYIIITATTSNVGSTSGSQKLNTRTENHALTVNEMPSHTHTTVLKKFTSPKPFGYSSQNTQLYAGAYNKETSQTGENAPHSHNLNISRHLSLIYKRVS